MHNYPDIWLIWLFGYLAACNDDDDDDDVDDDGEVEAAADGLALFGEYKAVLLVI